MEASDDKVTDLRSYVELRRCGVSPRRRVVVAVTVDQRGTKAPQRFGGVKDGACRRIWSQFGWAHLVGASHVVAEKPEKDPRKVSLPAERLSEFRAPSVQVVGEQLNQPVCMCTAQVDCGEVCISAGR